MLSCTYSKRYFGFRHKCLKVFYSSLDSPEFSTKQNAFTFRVKQFTTLVFLTLDMTVRSFETSITTRTSTERKIPGDLNPSNTTVSTSYFAIITAEKTGLMMWFVVSGVVMSSDWILCNGYVMWICERYGHN